MQTLPPFRTGTARALRGLVRPVEGVEIPYAVIEGERPGPRLLITAGVHGSEYCSIEVALRLMRRTPDAIRGTLVVLPILNVQGFRQRSIYVMPEDGKNLNRMFPGEPAGTTSQRLAHWLATGVYAQVDAYLDLHGGDLSEELAPFALYPGGSEPSKALATAFGLPIAVATGPHGTNYSIAAANRLGVPSVLAEVGGNGMWDEAGVDQMTRGVERVMAEIGMTDRTNQPPAPPAPEFVTMAVPAAPSDGLWYPTKAIGDTVAVGEVIGEIRDVFGAVLATVSAEKPGKVIYRLSSLVVNQGEALLGVATPLAQGA
jgi:hypothetical protein